MRQSGILLNGITRSSRVSPLQSPKHPMDHANKRAQSSTIAGSATVPGCPGIVRSASPRPSVSGPKSRDPITYNANKLLKIFVEGSDNVLLLGTILGTRHAQVEDISEPSELLEALRRRGRIPAVPSTPRPDERNVPFLKRLYVENGWGDLTYDEKAKI